MLLKGQLEQAQLENKTSDPSNTPDGLIWLNTTTNLFKAYIGAAIRTLVTTDQSQTLTNKTLTAPAITSPTGLVKGDVGLGNVDNTSDATKQAATIAALLAASNSWTGSNAFTAILAGDAANDTATGVAQTLSTAAKTIIRLTGSGLSVAGIPAPTSAQFLIVTNTDSTAKTVLNESGSATAANRILTGTGLTLSLAQNASLYLYYDLTSARWRVIGGSGGSSGPFIDTSTNVSLADSGTLTADALSYDQVLYVASATTAGATLSTTPFSATTVSSGARITLINEETDKPVIITYNDADGGIIGNFTTIEINYGQSVILRKYASFNGSVRYVLEN